MERIKSQPIVVVEVFVTKSQCPDALTQKLAQLVFDQAWQPIIAKTPRQPLYESHLQVDPSQKHRSSVAAQVTSGKIPPSLCGFHGLEIRKPPAYTLS
jgi:hypothetical protein